MKIWIPIIILFVAVTGLCVWDSIHTQQIFNHMESESLNIYSSLQAGENSEELAQKAEKLNHYWTKEMDILCISISRKDLQPVSDYLQYVCSSLALDDTENATTYARLLHYNVEGLKQKNGIDMLNLL